MKRRAKARTAWMAAPHRRCDVRSVLDLCIDVMHPVECLYASCTPSDELRFWVAVYERLRVAMGLPRVAATLHEDERPTPPSSVGRARSTTSAARPPQGASIPKDEPR